MARTAATQPLQIIYAGDPVTSDEEMDLEGPIVPGDSSPPVEVAPEDIGMNCEPKHVYEGKANCKCCINWVEEKPALRDPIESEKTAGYALLIRNKISHGTDGRKAMEIHSIVIQSPLLKRFLGSVLEDYPGVTPGLDRLVFLSPFQPFVHRWDRLEKAVDEEQDELTRNHLDMLLGILNTELLDTRNAMKDFVAHKVITFEHLWTIFIPGELVFTKMDDQECLFKLKSATYEKTLSGGKIFRLQCEFVDWNGSRYGKDLASLCLREYTGTETISDLTMFPFKYHPDKEEVQTRILARAGRFQELASVLYRAYEGSAYERNPYEPPPRDVKKHYIEGRIVIDAGGFTRFSGVEINLKPLKEAPVPIKMEGEHGHHGHDPRFPGGIPPPMPPGYHPPPGRGRRYNFGDTTSADDGAEAVQLTEEQLLICRHLVRGFSLKLKKWLDFHINNIEEIRWNEAAFESLVIPQGHKKLLMALSKSQNSSKAQVSGQFDDVIEGKGKGMVMLLSGPPGVGKTLTAESVAESMRVPLYAISAGDLGIHPEEVQERLSRCFQIVTSWNAVLLLDEADVFMEQRNVHDLVRNQMVSIFLQNLEYYQGTMFLTTNRVESFDPAFQSRIHVSIQYNDLEAVSRRQIWQNFLNRLPDPKHEIDEQAINNFASIEMNGRQIKNLIKAAGLIAADDGSPMRTEHVRTVLRIMYPSHNAGPMRTTYEEEGDGDLQIMQPS